jgi:hypothetical protein
MKGRFSRRAAWLAAGVVLATACGGLVPAAIPSADTSSNIHNGPSVTGVPVPTPSPDPTSNPWG